jgi:hypothetical protein
MDHEQSHLTLAISAELENLSQVIADDVSERIKAKKMLENIIKAVSEDNSELATKLVNKGVTKIASEYPQSKLTLQKLQVDLNRRQEEQVRQTCSQLEDYCRAKGIPVKGSSSKYMVDSFIDVELDRKKGRTKIGNLSLSTLKWPRILEALESEQARLWNREFSAEQFRKKLIEAYKQIEGSNSGHTGWASLEDVYQIIKREKEKEDPAWKKGGRLIAYYKDEFSVDLSLLWKAQASREVGIPHIELSAIRDPRRAFKVLQPDSNIGFFGFLRPKGT